MPIRNQTLGTGPFRSKKDQPLGEKGPPTVDLEGIARLKDMLGKYEDILKMMQ